MQQDPWDAAGPHPADDPRPGTGVWDVCAGWVNSRWMVPRRLYGWQLVERLTKPLIVEEKTAAPVWIPGRLRPDEDGRLRRCKANVEALSMLILDCDDGTPVERLRAMGDGAAEAAGGAYSLLRIGHTSFSHTPGKPKARIVFPLSSPVPAERWDAVWGAAQRWAASCGVVIDKAAKDPSRLWFAAAAPPGRAHLFESWVAGGTAVAAGCDLPGEGAPALLDPAWLVRAFAPPPPERHNRPITLARFGADDVPVHERRVKRMHGLLAHRVAHLQQIPPGGGQANSCYGNGRLVGQATAAGLVPDPDAWLLAFVDAGMAAGLPEKRAADNVRRGYALGLTEQLDQGVSDD